MLFSVEGCNGSGKSRCVEIIEKFCEREDIEVRKVSLFSGKLEHSIFKLYEDKEFLDSNYSETVRSKLDSLLLRAACETLLKYACLPELYVVEGLTSFAAKVYNQNPASIVKAARAAGLLFQVVVHATESDIAIRSSFGPKPTMTDSYIEPVSVMRNNDSGSERSADQFGSFIVSSAAPSVMEGDIKEKVIPVLRALHGNYLASMDVFSHQYDTKIALTEESENLKDRNLLSRFAVIRPGSVKIEKLKMGPYLKNRPTWTVLRESESSGAVTVALGKVLSFKMSGLALRNVTIPEELLPLHGLPVAVHFNS
jgi:hypothetical protein